MNPIDASGAVMPYLTSAATIVYVQKWLKHTSLYARVVAAFPGAGTWVHWGVAALGSLIAAAGIHITWHWDPTVGGQASAVIPGLAAMQHGLVEWFKVYITQHTVYGATTRLPNGLPPVKP